MQCEQADPACYMDGVLVWMISFFGNLVGDVMDCDDTVKKEYQNKNQ